MKQGLVFYLITMFLFISGTARSGELVSYRGMTGGRLYASPPSKSKRQDPQEILDTLFTGANPNRCRMRGNVLENNSSESVYDCLELWSGVAEASFASECGGAVTKDLLMCIFLREQRGAMEKNECLNFGCGVAQMTGKGALGVQDALFLHGALDSYRQFFINIGRPDLAEEDPRSLNRDSARNMQRSVAMASALLCQKFYEGARSQMDLAFRYNGNSRARTTIQIPYRKFVGKCLEDFKDGSISEHTRSGGAIKQKSARLQMKHSNEKNGQKNEGYGIKDIF